MSSSITTLTFFRFSGIRDKTWAFRMMRDAHQQIEGAEGLTFYKLMGSGRGLGFNPLPDFSTYALLMVWDTEIRADEFLRTSGLLKDYRKRTREIWTVYLKAITSKGQWSGSNPFIPDAELPKGPIAVLTRATIKRQYLVKFWKYVPISQKPIENHPELIFTKGIGEVPVVQMATFSLWKSAEGIGDFAYNSSEHKKAIEMTRKLDWYGEELFARFRPFRSEGTWNGTDPLQTFIK